MSKSSRRLYAKSRLSPHTRSRGRKSTRRRRRSLVRHSCAWPPRSKGSCPVNVAELQKYLQDLSDFVEGAGGKKVADDLRAVVGALKPFSARPVKQFAEFLKK